MKITLNTETLTKDWPLVEALMNGKTVQFYNGDKWCDYNAADTHIVFEFHRERRIKTEPKFRKWKSEEVPVGAGLRLKDQPNAWRGMITACNEFRLFVTTEAGGIFFASALETMEHSTDNGKTWKPCGVEL